MNLHSMIHRFERQKRNIGSTKKIKRPKNIKIKLIVGLAAVLGGVLSAFALMDFVQLKPEEMRLYPNIAMRSWLDTNGGNEMFWIALLPDKGGQSTNLQGYLELYERSNHLAECPVAGNVLSDVFGKGWGAGPRREYYMAMTNKFARPLNGTRLYTFTVATNTLAKSRFSLSDPANPDLVFWFYLKDFQSL